MGLGASRILIKFFLTIFFVLFLTGICFANNQEEQLAYKFEFQNNLLQIHAQNISFKEILSDLEEKTGIKVVIFGEVPDAKVSLDIKSLPLHSVGSLLLQMKLFNYKELANGVVIGDYIGIEDKGFWVLSENNFIFLINKDGHLFSGRVAFSTPDCTGQRSASAVYEGRSFMNIFQDYHNEGVYMLYPTAEKVVIGETFYMDSGTCFNWQSTSQDYYPIYPNDPSITGVQSSYTGPITLER